MKTATVIADESAPLFKPFTWVAPHLQRGPYDLLSDVRDVAAGTALLLEIVERSQMANENDEAPILDNFDVGRLMRMAIASMHFVEGRIDNHLAHLADPERCPASESTRGGA
jgi:hypothetical protein